MRIGRNCAPLVDTFAPEVKDVFGFSAAVTRGLTLLDALDKARQNRGERPAGCLTPWRSGGKGCAAAHRRGAHGDAGTGRGRISGGGAGG